MVRIALSIDSGKSEEAGVIEITIRSERKAVEQFLKELKGILLGEGFLVEDHLIIIRSRKEEVQYSTRFTLADLNYDAEDVAARLAELTVAEYSETLFDRDNEEPPLLFVFGKDINGRLIYIKLKIRVNKVLCVSFHYAKWEMGFPYA